MSLSTSLAKESLTVLTPTSTLLTDESPTPDAHADYLLRFFTPMTGYASHDSVTSDWLHYSYADYFASVVLN